MTELRRYELVRVRQLPRPPGEYDGWGVNQRPQLVGEVGWLIDGLQTPGVSDAYVVESSGPDGITIWLADSLAGEIEPAGPDLRHEG